MGNSEHREPEGPPKKKRGRPPGVKDGQGRGRPVHETRKGSSHPVFVDPAVANEKVDRRKNGAHLFQPGNPSRTGNRPLPPDVQVLRETGREQLIRAYHKFTCLQPGDPIPEPVGFVEEAVLRNLYLWAQTGNSAVMEKLWDRTLGKAEQWLLVAQGPDGRPATGLQIVLDRLPEPGSVGAVIETEAIVVDSAENVARNPA